MNLADLLEQQSNERMSKLPTIDPVSLPPVQMEQPRPTSTGMEGLLPLLMGGANPRRGSLGGGMGGGSVEQQAHRYFTNQGYSPSDWQKVESIIGRESSWDPHAVNSSSGAAGIAQNINGFSSNYSRNDPQEQIRWLYNYFQNHNYPGYGTGIDAAYAHKNATGWY